MDTRRRGRDLVPESFPEAVRRRLSNLDRLREVWAERRRYGHSADDPAVSRGSARRRVEALRLLAGADTAPGGAVAAEEEAFLAMAEDCRAGVRLTPEYFDALVQGVPDYAPPLPVPAGVGALLAEAAAVETHPVIRAAHLFLTCVDAFDAEAGGVPGRTGAPSADSPMPGPGVPAVPDANLRPLPWWLAALSLMRSDLPPPAIDRRCPPLPSPTASGAVPQAAPPAAGHEPTAPHTGRDQAAPDTAPAAAVPAPRAPEDRLTALVLLLVDLETAALRSELSRVSRAPVAARSESGRLAAAVHRRVVEHLRLRCASLRLVLRELDPRSRAVVSSSTGGPALALPGDTVAAHATEGAVSSGAGAGAAGGEPAGAATATAPEGNVAPSTGERRDAAARRAMFTPGGNDWHAALDIDLADGVLQLLVFVQEVGSTATGVLAVTADGWLTTDDGAMDVLEPGCADCVTLLPTDGADDRWPEVEAFVDDMIARSVGHLTRTARY